MKLRLLFLFGLVALVVADDTVSETDEQDVGETDGLKQFARRPRKKTDDQLYREVDASNYDRAITLVQDYISRGQTNVIKAAITKLLKNRKTNAAGFAYKLFAAGHRDIVEQYFPKQFKMVFSDSLIKFTNNRFNLPIDYDITFQDGDGDYRGSVALTETNSNNHVWKLDPVVEGNNVYFHIRQNNNNVYLKLGTGRDGDGDWTMFASPSANTRRHLWKFMPVYFNGRLMFCIVNNYEDQGLKLSNKIYSGRRDIYGTDGDYYRYPERFGWKVSVISDNDL